jgi:predicted ATPase
MRIALIGAHCVGKSTLIEEFLKKWPMYKTPEKTYRDIIKDKNLQLNRAGDKASQKEILNALVDEVQLATASGDEYIIFDRCPIDNIAYTLWHYGKHTEGFDAEFIITCKDIAALSLKYLDLVFYVPARMEIPLVAKENREIDELFREEVDNIFDSLVTSYEKNTGAFFPAEDCPAVIRLDGPPDMRIPQMELYIKPSGKPFGEEDGSLLDVTNV